MKLTWMGTAAFVLESGDQKILFDPFRQLAGGETAVSAQELLQYDTVFVTHCHFDHLYETEELISAGGNNTTVFCTKQSCDTLERFLEDASNVVCIRPGQTYALYNEQGDALHTHPQPGDPGYVSIHVLQGRHIDFRYRYLFDTLSPWRVLRYARNLPFLYWANRLFKEAGEIVAFDVRAQNREILILGSLALDPEETYPEHVDVLVLPYQGNNDLPARAREVLARLQPRSVILSHFDNAFPPMSRTVDLRPLKKMMEEEFPQIKVVKPTAFKPVEL